MYFILVRRLKWTTKIIAVKAVTDEVYMSCV